MPGVVALGDLNVDIIAHFDRYPAEGEDALASATEIHCGGSAANAAMALARMGIHTTLISRVGPDSWALKALGSLEEAGVDPRCLQRDAVTMTGMMYVVVTSGGERTILGHRGANVLTDPNQIRESDIQEADLFHLSGYALLSEPQRSAALLALEMACRNHLAVTLDPGMTISNVALDEMHALLPVVDILLPSRAEAQALTSLSAPRDSARALLDSGVKVVALKLGQDGCLIATGDQLIRVPAFAVETRDSTGAGDSFAAGFIVGFLGGLDWTSSAILGNAMGAMSAAHVGAGTAVPSAQEVLSLLRDRKHEVTHRKCMEEIRQVIDYVTNLAEETAEEEERKPWWA
jgi:ribokinase